MNFIVCQIMSIISGSYWQSSSTFPATGNVSFFLNVLSSFFFTRTRISMWYTHILLQHWGAYQKTIVTSHIFRNCIERNLSIHPFQCWFIHSPFHWSIQIHQSIHLPVRQSCSPSIHTPIHPPLHQSINKSISLPIHQQINPSIQQFTNLSTILLTTSSPVYQLIHPSINSPIHQKKIYPSSGSPIYEQFHPSINSQILKIIYPSTHHFTNH